MTDEMLIAQAKWLPQYKPELAAAKGIIIDLRKNGGGSSLNSSAIVGHFTDKTFTGAAWRTVIHDGVFIGSDSMLVAPVEIGENSTTGAGSVVTKDVPPDTIVVGMPARQIRKKNKK